MNCPSCNSPTRVLESRRSEDGFSVRRRRECSRCGRRLTTREQREAEPLVVRKRDGTLESFDRAKLTAGLLRAAHKRPVDPAGVERIADRIVGEGEAAGGELRAERIGELCLAGLRELDRVAYLQFAAVYKGFTDPGEFTEELRRLGMEPPALGGDPAERGANGESPTSQTPASTAGSSVRLAEQHSSLPVEPEQEEREDA